MHLPPGMHACAWRCGWLQYCLKHRLDVLWDESQGYMRSPCAGTYVKICEWLAPHCASPLSQPMLQRMTERVRMAMGMHVHVHHPPHSVCHMHVHVALACHGVELLLLLLQSRVWLSMHPPLMGLAAGARHAC